MLNNLTYNFVSVVGKGSVYENKSGKQTLGFAFYYILNDGDKKRKVVTGNSEEELRQKVVQFLDKLEKEFTEGKETLKTAIEETCKDKKGISRKTFEEVAYEWFSAYSKRLNAKRNKISYSTLECRELPLKKILNNMDDVYIDEFTQDMADDLMERCSVKKDGTLYSYSYMDKLQQVFNMVMEFAVDNGYCTHKFEPIPLNNFPKGETDKKFLDRDQLAEIFNILDKNIRYSRLVRLLVSTGLRQEEAFALTVDDFIKNRNGNYEVAVTKTVVKTGKNVYGIAPKTKSARGKRNVPIPKYVYEDIMDYYNTVTEDESPYDTYLRKLNGTEKLIFANKDKEVMNKHTFRTSFTNFLNRNGGNKLGYEVNLHMFRHTYASLMAEKLPPEVVAKLLGDTIEVVIKNYYSFSNKVKSNIASHTTDILNSIDKLT